MKVGRRGFLGLLGFGAIAPLFGKGKEASRLFVSQLVPDEEIIPGVARWQHSFCEACMAGCGTRIRTREGIAVKIEGNPPHPVGRGGLCPRGQAEIFDLYHPDRIPSPLLKNGTPVKWEEAVSLIEEHFAAKKANGTLARTAFLSRGFTGSRKAFIEAWMKEAGSDALVFFEPDGYEAERMASLLSFGQDTIPHFAIDEARYLVSFGADFLETWLSPVSFAHEFAELRAGGQQDTVPFIHFDSRLSLTAANADKRIWVRPGDETLIALAMAHVIVNEGNGRFADSGEHERIKKYLDEYPPADVAKIVNVPANLIEETAREFAKRSPSLAIAGGSLLSHQDKCSSLIAVNLLNHVAGNVNRTVRFDRAENRGGLASFRSLVEFFGHLKEEKIETLVLYEGNPLYWFPEAAEILKDSGLFIIAFGDTLNETNVHADVILPVPHPLESWRDSEPRRGVFNISRPATRPVSDRPDPFYILSRMLRGRETAETLEAFMKKRWEKLRADHFPGVAQDAFWQDALNAGFVEMPAEAEQGMFREEALSHIKVRKEAVPFFLMAYFSSRFSDGRGADNPWLNELPDPVTTICWDSWIEMDRATAGNLGISSGDVVRLASGEGAAEGPVYIQPSMSPDCAAIPIGHGRREAGRYAKGTGLNPLALMPRAFNEAGGPVLIQAAVTLSGTGKHVVLAKAQGSDSQQGRGIFKEVSPGGSQKKETRESAAGERLYPTRRYTGYRWGMVIDLNRCIGCGACVLACSAENNVPFVGRELCLKGRQMSWLRIERYFEGGDDGLQAGFLPMLCQHCNNAPCEPVCPVYATVQSSEGLNTQVYSRCVGTRYCSNNCPYKVRRFNWFTYHIPEEFKRQRNPDVPARTVGVMEKCTFCVQRIREGKDRAKDEKRTVIDGEIKTACSESCPAGAIVFGDLNDKQTRVSQLSRSETAYRVFEGLSTEPSVFYLKKKARQ